MISKDPWHYSFNTAGPVPPCGRQCYATRLITALQRKSKEIDGAESETHLLRGFSFTEAYSKCDKSSPSPYHDKRLTERSEVQLTYHIQVLQQTTCPSMSMRSSVSAAFCLRQVLKNTEFSRSILQYDGFLISSCHLHLVTFINFLL